MSQSAMSRAIQCILISINYSYVYLTKLAENFKNSETVLCQIRKTTNNPPFRCGQKNMWKRIPHLMQQYDAPRKGHCTVNLHE